MTNKVENKRVGIKNRIVVSFLIIFLFGVAIAWKAGRTMTVEKKYWTQQSELYTTKFLNIDAIRGNIYASDGSLLATSIPEYELRIDFKAEGFIVDTFLKHLPFISLELSKIFPKKSHKEFKQQLLTAYKLGERAHLLASKVDHIELKKIKQINYFAKGKNVSGLVVFPKSRRIMPFYPLALRTIGYKKESVKPVGLEGAFDNELSGITGEILMKKVSGNAYIPLSNELKKEPIDGKDIITTIDVNIQDYTHTALLNGLMEHGADHGCAIVMEVATGNIKAISNLKLSSNNTYNEEFNYAIGEATEPGSTIKLVTALALLEDASLDPKKLVNIENGTTKFYDRIMKDSERDTNNINYKRQINLYEAFALSSNVAFSKLVFTNYKDKPAAYISFLEKLKLNTKIGVPIFGEAKPYITNVSDSGWSGTTLPWLSIGYGLKCTPLQILTLYNGIANNGKAMKPKLVTEIRKPNKTYKKYEDEVYIDKMALEENIEIVKKMCELTISNGTAKEIKSNEYAIAGKTGTSLIANTSTGYKENKRYQASFVGYFPADEPVYSIIVVVSHPKNKQYYGSKVAAPIFKQIADKVYASYIFNRKLDTTTDLRSTYYTNFMPPKSHLKNYVALSKIFPNQTMSFNSTQDWISFTFNRENYDTKPLQIQPNLMPNLEGMPLADAIFVLESLNYKVKTQGNGKVVKTYPAVGSKIYSNQTITLISAKS